MHREIRYHGARFFFPLLAVLILLYFIYHLIQGDHGWRAWWDLRKQMGDEKQTLVTLQAEQEALARRVALLGSKSLDPDLLDERARAMLNHAAPDEVVIFTNNPGDKDI